VSKHVSEKFKRESVKHSSHKLAAGIYTYNRYLVVCISSGH
jgi:hypothetical protein